jgi:heterodisulfide reductase subunit A-like polyferredoxin
MVRFLKYLVASIFLFSVLGGNVPKHDINMETTVKGLYIAGDISGVEEASTAMEEGRLAGVACAQSLHLLNDYEAEKKKKEIWKRLNTLRTGPFGEKRRVAKEKILKATEGGKTA